MAVKINKQTAQAKASSAKANDSAKAKATATDETAKATASSGTKFTKGKKTTGEKKAPSAKREERHHAFTERIEFCAGLILSQKLTDEEIIAKVTEKFPDYAVVFNQKEVGRTRWMLRADKLANVHADGACFDRIYLIDGKKVAKADKPKSASAKRKARYTAENDPLVNLGVNVHDSAEAKAAKAKKPIKKTKKASAEATAEASA